MLDLSIRDIAINPAQPDQLWIATAAGIYSLEYGDPTQIAVRGVSGESVLAFPAQEWPGRRETP